MMNPMIGNGGFVHYFPGDFISLTTEMTRAEKLSLPQGHVTLSSEKSATVRVGVRKWGEQLKCTQHAETEGQHVMPGSS